MNSPIWMNEPAGLRPPEPGDAIKQQGQMYRGHCDSRVLVAAGASRRPNVANASPPR